MDLSKLSASEREKTIRAEQKAELTTLVLHYFSTFGWNTKKEDENIFVQKILPGEPWQRLIVVNAPHEEFPSSKALKTLLKQSPLIVVSSEFSPRLKRTKAVVEQHTASGINFSYLRKPESK